MGKILHIRLVSLQILHQNGIEQSYFCITYGEKQYFSSTFDHYKTNLQDDILIELEENSPPEHIAMDRWQSCMIVFSLEVEISELKNRTFTKKKIQTRQKEFLNLEFQIYEQQDIMFTDKYVQNISQHYLIIEDLCFINEKNNVRTSKQPNYFSIATKHANYIVPLRGAIVLLKLPNAIEISSFINNVFNGKSGSIKHQKLKDNDEISIDKDTKSMGKVNLKLRWAVNLHRCRIDQNLLMQSNELMFYDFQFKFDNPADLVSCHFKISHGSKTFDFTEDIDKNKVTKIKKVIFFIIKTENQEVDFILQKNGKIFSHFRFNTSEISSSGLSTIKKKWVDLINPAKIYGSIKLRGERGRNLSTPQSNKYWREVLRHKNNHTNMMLSIHQASVYSSNNQPLLLVAKIENEEKLINSLTNLNFFEDQDEPSRDVLEFDLKGEESLYMIVKSDAKSSDFCGIGVVNTTDLHLGLNVCEVGFFKNQEKAGTINCLLNKMLFWPFLKPLFQSEPQLPPQSTLWIDIFFNNITLSPYFYTYRYDSKEELYCIVEVNKVKKVLILQNTAHDQLSFFASAGSDTLNFSVFQLDYIKIKISFLVSDLGHEEEIYGTATCKVKVADISQELKLKNIEICNDYSVVLGTVNLEVSKSTPPKQQIKQIKHKTSTNECQKPSAGSFDLSQASFDSNPIPHKSNHHPRRYSGGNIHTPKPISQDFLKKNTHQSKYIHDVKLPVIKEKKNKESFNDLLHMMKVRKRQLGGTYEQKGLSSNKHDDRVPPKLRHSFDLRKLEQSNPNIDRNLQILFPRKVNQKHVQMIRAKHNDYQDKLKGLKSVMNEINDIGEVEPSIRESREGKYEHEDFQQPEWEGNQFAHP